MLDPAEQVIQSLETIAAVARELQRTGTEELADSLGLASETILHALIELSSLGGQSAPAKAGSLQKIAL